MRFGLLVALILVTGTASQLRAATTGSDLSLTYDKPAEKWTEALPIGNGRIGAMVFRGTEDERLQINESTLWGGGPHDYANPGAYTHLEEIRLLIFAGKVDEAQKLSETMMGQPKLLMPYQPFCHLRLHFPGHGQTTDYRRELHLKDAIAETSYKVGSAQFRREAFISYPDQLLIVRGGGKLDLEWRDGHLTKLVLSCDHSMKYRVLNGDGSSEVEIPPGRPIVLDGTLHRISQ